MNFNENSLTRSILSMLFLGAVLGLVINDFFYDTMIKSILIDEIFDLGAIFFIASLKMLVVPLVFISLVKGVFSLGDIKKLGSLGLQSFFLYIITTAIAISFAIFISLLVQPGLGFDLSSQGSFSPTVAPPLKETLVNIFPANPFKSFVEGNMLQVIVFSIFIGFGLLKSTEKNEHLLGLLDNCNQVILNLVNFFMTLAPYAVLMLITKVFAQSGLQALKPLMAYFLVVVSTLFLHCFITYVPMIKFLGKRSPLDFFRKIKSAQVLAFSTASSTMTLPITMKSVINNLGVNRSIASFSLSLGSTINMDGTAIMQGVATVFIAQAYNINIDLMGYLTVVLMATLASIGTAAVPGVGLITLAMVLTQVGLPVEGIGLIIGVDRLLDMFRTAVNITGDATVACVLGRWNGNKIEK